MKHLLAMLSAFALYQLLEVRRRKIVQYNENAAGITIGEVNKKLQDSALPDGFFYVDDDGDGIVETLYPLNP